MHRVGAVAAQQAECKTTSAQQVIGARAGTMQVAAPLSIRYTTHQVALVQKTTTITCYKQPLLWIYPH
jgi:hypothetical protein